VSIIFGLATGEMSVSSVRFGYRCDVYELDALIYSWVTREQIHPSE
jgi:hypothetical protein